jgi:hypothetical protein
MSMTPRRIARTFALVLCIPITACHGWQSSKLSPGQNMTWNDQVRVTLASGEVVSMLSAQVQRDTLFGRPLYGRADSVARYPVSAIRQVESRGLSSDRTAAAVVGSGIGAALLVATAVLFLLGSLLRGE